MTNWLNARFQATYPPIALKSNLPAFSEPPTFTNIFDSDANFNFLCIVPPTYENKSILTTLEFPFDSTTDLVQNSTFFDVPEIIIEYGEWVNLSFNGPSVANSIFLANVEAQANGILPNNVFTSLIILYIAGGAAVVLSSHGCSSSILVTPDDWSWVWEYPVDFSPYTLVSSPTLNSGWLALGQTPSDCSFSITSVITASISLNSSVSLRTIQH